MQTDKHNPLIETLLELGVQSNFAECLAGGASYRKYEAKDNVFVEGDLHPNVVYVLSGYLRLYATDESGDISTRLIAGPGELAGCITGILYGTPAQYTAECISDCHLLIVNNNVISDAQMRPETRVILQDVILKKLVGIMQEKAIMLPMKATDRYLFFRERYPGLINRIPAGILANYIGVRPQSLSRIKHMLK